MRISKFISCGIWVQMFSGTDLFIFVETIKDENKDFLF